MFGQETNSSSLRSFCQISCKELKLLWKKRFLLIWQNEVSGSIQKIGKLLFVLEKSYLIHLKFHFIIFPFFFLQKNNIFNGEIKKFFLYYARA